MPWNRPAKEQLFAVFDASMIDTITYKQWTAVDRSTLETVNQRLYDFVETFCEKLEALRSRSFIATQQSHFFDQCKSSLKPGELVVCADFSENYAFVLQDAAQGFHWNNAQATLHPFVAYFRESNTSEISHLNFVVISECLHHDTVAVHLFQRKLISFLQDRLSIIPVTFQMVQLPSIKTERILSTSATTRQILEYQLNGIFPPYHMVKVLVMGLVAL